MSEKNKTLFRVEDLGPHGVAIIPTEPVALRCLRQTHQAVCQELCPAYRQDPTIAEVVPEGDSGRIECSATANQACLDVAADPIAHRLTT